MRFDPVAPAPFFLDIGTTENLGVNNGRDYVITAGNGLANLIKLTIDGSAGNDRFIWNPGDGNDVVDGQDGTDTLVFNGANVAETMSISANHGKVSLVRDVANITMDLDKIEHIELNALGGGDKITVNDLTGTDVTQVTVDLGANDGGADQVTVNGTNGSDQINVVATATGVAVSGLPAQVNIDHPEAGDLLTATAPTVMTRSMRPPCLRVSLASPSTVAPAATGSRVRPALDRLDFNGANVIGQWLPSAAFICAETEYIFTIHARIGQSGSLVGAALATP